ncbi:MAG: LysR family transcriptional regulator [Gammaproteobacteria bacterium]|uniref:LysR family transcriptional regulator n=1 Tax=Pseudomaricurvus alcaniphilus TaxID=1166482 RepID=UPI00140922A2|nr:LysR family transcriptional regulator [Pseudomaricurvus alcaniphilus]MBR9913141.1 LysR family transcriptional regulator [Gammaproteobacteria bacterium]NHN37557.1 LysR family transcriptional regulator [Pseudomaricurvus alcaniphilus]
MSRWDATEIFVTVVNEGSFSAASRRLGLSKSHASRQVSQLENRLGVQLLQRTTRKLALTETGQAYYQRCSDIVNQLNEVELAVIDQQEKPRGNLRLTVAGAFGERYVAPAAAIFMQQHPELSIELDFTNRNVDLVAEGYDLAIRAGVLKDSSLIARRIANRQLITCASRDYFDRYGFPEDLRALKAHNCLVGSLPTWRFRDESGQHLDIKVEGNWHSNNGHALLAAARKGLGLVQLPEFYVYADINAGRLQTTLESFQATDTAVWAIYPSNRHLSPKVRMFVEHLVSQFETVDYL